MYRVHSVQFGKPGSNVTVREGETQFHLPVMRPYGFEIDP